MGYKVGDKVTLEGVECTVVAKNRDRVEPAVLLAIPGGGKQWATEKQLAGEREEPEERSEEPEERSEERSEEHSEERTEEETTGEE